MQRRRQRSNRQTRRAVTPQTGRRETAGFFYGCGLPIGRIVVAQVGRSMRCAVGIRGSGGTPDCTVLRPPMTGVPELRFDGRTICIAPSLVRLRSLAKFFGSLPFTFSCCDFPTPVALPWRWFVPAPISARCRTSGNGATRASRRDQIRWKQTAHVHSIGARNCPTSRRSKFTRNLQLPTPIPGARELLKTYAPQLKTLPNQPHQLFTWSAARIPINGPFTPS